MNFRDKSYLTDEQTEIPFKTPWQYADFRMKSWVKSAKARNEFLLVFAMLALLFAPSLVTWIRRWLLPGSFQGYAIWVIPLALGWLWINRRKVVLPELDALNQQFTERSVLRFLVEEEPEEPKRLIWILVVGAVLTPLALRFGEPGFTCIAFLTVLTGIIAYRFGTHALRGVAFPLLFMATMIPLPGIATDTLHARTQGLLFKVTRNLLQIAGLNAELSADNNPLIIFGNPHFEMFAGQVGTGIPEAAVFLLLLLCWLSLISTQFRYKIAGFVSGILWISLLVSLRLMLLASVGRGMDKDDFATLVPISLWLIPFLGMAGQMLILRGLKCRQLHEWVSVS